MYYSAKLNGFYSNDFPPAPPDDAVKITDDYYHQLLAGQASGQRIVADADGYPVLADPPGPTEAQLAEAVRAERDQKLADGDRRVLQLTRQIREAERSGQDTAALAAELAAWDARQAALCDVPQQDGFPQAVDWPTEVIA